jgi:hypothetical protein
MAIIPTEMRSSVSDAELAEIAAPSVVLGQDIKRDAIDLAVGWPVGTPCDRMASVAQVDMAGRPWWWHRVPVSGPIVEGLTHFMRNTGANHSD